MARLSTYKDLVETYANVINESNFAIVEAEAEAKALHRKLAEVEATIAHERAKRDRAITEVRGVRDLIRTLEDYERAEERQKEDNEPFYE